MGSIQETLGPLLAAADKEVEDVTTQTGVVDTAKAAEAAQLAEYQEAQAATVSAREGLGTETVEARAALQSLIDACQSAIEQLP
jgi:hypothetical protein